MNCVLTEKSPKLDVYADIPLFPHQKALVHQLVEMETIPRKETFIGVMNDPPGAGKSFPLLALILHEKRMIGKTQNLLVIPHNIHEQWLEYIKTFSKELTVKSLMYYGDVNALLFDARVLFEYDILVTTSSFYPMITDTIKNINAWFNRVIIDEIDSLSFFTNVKIPSQCVWLVSATALSTKSGAYKEQTKKNIVQCDPLFIKKSINLPSPLLDTHSCNNDYVEILYDDILSENAPMFAVDYSFYKFEYVKNQGITSAKDLLSSVYKNFVLEILSLNDSVIKLERDVKYQTNLEKELAIKKGKIITNTEKIAKILEKTKDKMCAMCGDYFFNAKTSSVPHDLENKYTTKCCSGVFCKNCLEKWIEKIGKCPKCLQDIKIDHIQVLTEKTLEIVKSPKNDKIAEFQNILEQESSKENFRILIFSDYIGSFTSIYEILKTKNLKYAEIEGNQITMQNAIRDYISGERPVLLVESQQYGAGMNLEITTALVIMHKTSRESQIIGRAQRLGRKDRLSIHHLVYPQEK